MQRFLPTAVFCLAAGFVGPAAFAATAAPPSGAYQSYKEQSTCSAVTSCSLVLPAAPAGNAIEVHTVSCTVQLGFSNWITPPIQFSTVTFGSTKHDAIRFLTPIPIGAVITGGNSSGQVVGTWYFTVSDSAISYISAGARPTISLEVTNGQFSSELIGCTVSGKLVAP